ncbi:MAG: sodium:calcium antiporter [Actinomycetota bacterium]|nr:sodium:calcium antiporter [Actinomycetota bacterium]MEC9394799.1 sodium:calcium antiporter [Actinomycetota bacterium]MED6328231.1 sodium:calcium antiporter [Actinomycetota bacterium]MEE2958846.1 sodium:calcium antiporter [Actinomycetota bacterium]
MGALVAIVVLAAGLALLMAAADRFVGCASDLAVRLNVPPIVVGALVVGFGTSAPELVVSTMAAAQGEVDLGLGNIVGSNVANLTLVLGTAALIRPIDLPVGTKRRALLCLATVALFGWLVQGEASVLEGLVLLVGMVVALVAMVRIDAEDLSAVQPTGGGSALATWALTLGSLVATVVSAQAVVWAATDIAERAGLADGFVGFSLVALGTSLPELVTVVAAARRNQSGLIVGSLLGSNVFNSMAVGAGLFLAGDGVVSDVDLQVRGSVAAVLVALVAVVAMRTVGRNRIIRSEGVVLLAMYAATLVVLATSAGA